MAIPVVPISTINQIPVMRQGNFLLVSHNQSLWRNHSSWQVPGCREVSGCCWMGAKRTPAGTQEAWTGVRKSCVGLGMGARVQVEKGLQWGHESRRVHRGPAWAQRSCGRLYRLERLILMTSNLLCQLPHWLWGNQREGHKWQSCDHGCCNLL